MARLCGAILAEYPVFRIQAARLPRYVWSQHVRRHLHHPAAVRRRRVEPQIVSTLQAFPEADPTAEDHRQNGEAQLVDEPCVEALTEEIIAVEVDVTVTGRGLGFGNDRSWSGPATQPSMEQPR